MLDPTIFDSPEGENPKFNTMLKTIHVNEEWFYLMKDGQKLYLLPNEPEQQQTYKRKSFIPEIMFLAAVARLLRILVGISGLMVN